MVDFYFTNGSYFFILVYIDVGDEDKMAAANWAFEIIWAETKSF